MRHYSLLRAEHIGAGQSGRAWPKDNSSMQQPRAVRRFSAFRLLKFEALCSARERSFGWGGIDAKCPSRLDQTESGCCTALMAIAQNGGSVTSRDVGEV